MDAKFGLAVRRIQKVVELTEDNRDPATRALVYQAQMEAEDAVRAQTRLVGQIGNLIDRLQRTRQDLVAENGCWNSCGIIQGQGTEIDLLVGVLEAKSASVMKWAWTLERVFPNLADELAAVA